MRKYVRNIMLKSNFTRVELVDLPMAYNAIHETEMQRCKDNDINADFLIMQMSYVIWWWWKIIMCCGSFFSLTTSIMQSLNELEPRT